MSCDVVHDLAGLSDATHIGSSHCLRVLSVGSLQMNNDIQS